MPKRNTPSSAPNHPTSPPVRAGLAPDGPASRPADAPPPLGRRIFELVCLEPSEDAIASLGTVMISLLLAEADQPLETFDTLAVRIRDLLIAAKQRDEADRSIH